MAAGWHGVLHAVRRRGAQSIALPWVSFNSDAASLAPEGVFLKSNPHPRAYGSFARVLGKYVRDEQLISLEEAIRKLATLPSMNLKIERRGQLRTGFFADVVVFDPEPIQDHATFVEPHQYATGMLHVFVNGEQVLRTASTPAPPGSGRTRPGLDRELSRCLCLPLEYVQLDEDEGDQPQERIPEVEKLTIYAPVDRAAKKHQVEQPLHNFVNRQ